MTYTLTTTTPGSGNLVTRDALKAELGIDPGDTSQDAAIDLVLDQVGADFVNGLGRTPWVQTYEVRIAGQGGYLLALPVWPVIEVVSVTTSSGTEVTGWELQDTNPASRRRDLWKAGCWKQGRISRAPASSGDQELNFVVVVRAGWPMRDQVGTWAPSTPYTAGQWVEVTSRPGDLMEVTTAGTSGTGEPEWPAVGETVTDGTVEWTARRASKLPANLAMAAVVHGVDLYRGAARLPGNVERVTDEGGTVVFDLSRSGVSRFVQNAWSAWR